MGAVKEQSANLYAAKMAERGFVTLALDLPFYGGATENPGIPFLRICMRRRSARPRIIWARGLVDRDRIGVIGICGSGSFAISAAKIDPRLKAIATVSMYDMGAASRNGLRICRHPVRERRFWRKRRSSGMSFSGGPVKYTGGTVHELREDSSPI